MKWIRFFSLTRFYNLFLLGFSYSISLILRRPIVWNAPFALTVEPNNYCNFRCPQCPTGIQTSKRNKGNIPISLFEKSIEETYKRSFWLNLYFQGEPLLHPHISDLIRIAKARKFYVSISTNGSLLDEKIIHDLLESKLDELIISVDGSNATSYAKYRIGGDFREIIKNIAMLVKAKHAGKSAMKIVLQSLIFRHNEAEIEEIKKLGKELGVDKVELKSAQFYSFEDSELQPPASEKYSRYRSDSENSFLMKRKKNKNSCFRLWSTVVITHAGDVVPCCYDKDNSFILGNIKEEIVTRVWKGKKFNGFRKKVLQRDNEIAICKNCNL